jgi:acyl-CoA synthetase (AMP-forming)/AMP-acid ligase II
MNRLQTVFDAVATHARLQPQKLAVRDSRRSLSYAQLHDRASRLAQALGDLGLQKGDRVALLAYNCAEWMELYAALAGAGLVAVPINFRLTPDEMAYIVHHSQARCAIVQHTLLAQLEAVRRDLPAVDGRCVVFGGPPPSGWLAYEPLIAQAAPLQPPSAVHSHDMSALMYTSGTTGKPKGVIRSHEGSTLIAMATALEMGFTGEDTGLMVMPMCHANSLYFSHTFVHLGATCVIDDRASFDPEGLLSTLAAQRITFTSLVPTHYTMMLALPSAIKARHDVSRVGKLMISSAPARRETKLAILDHFRNAQLYELYGSTEAGWVTLLRPHEQLDKLGSVGREWAMSGPIKLLDERGQEVPDGEVGELHSRTAYAFDGYWQNPEKTAEAFRGDWCSVGDLARRDAQGFIHLVDRKSNMIITGGENVYPTEVEAVVAAHPDVRDVAVVGLPHEKWGESVHAVVVLHEGAHTTADELLQWCKARIAGYKRPRRLTLVNEADLPRTATGKIQHRLLRERLLQTEPALDCR